MATCILRTVLWSQDKLFYINITDPFMLLFK